MKKTELEFIKHYRTQIGTYKHGRMLVRAIGIAEKINESGADIYRAEGIDRQGNKYFVFWGADAFYESVKHPGQPFCIEQRN
jgi:hypothetical protein